MPQSEIRLYDVHPEARESLCSFGACGKRIAFVPGAKPGSRVPVSLDHPDAKKDESGKTIKAPSHFQDCAGANTFSKSGRRQA